jgi:hypothetical protein
MVWRLLPLVSEADVMWLFITIVIVSIFALTIAGFQASARH